MVRPKARTAPASRVGAAAKAPAPAIEEPRFPLLWAALVYALFTLVLAYPALSGGFLVNPRNDQYLAGYAFREFAASSLRAGHGIPQWNPYLFGGMPYVAAMHGDIFYPTALLRMLVGTDTGMTWGFIIHLFLSGLFAFGFLRAWGLRFYAALLGGVAYMLSGQIVSFVSAGHDGKLFVSTMFPLTLWLLVRGVRDGRAWAWGTLAIVIGLAVLSPHPQLLQYMLLASGAFALVLAFSDNEGRGKLPRDVALKRLGLALAAVIVGGVMGAIQYLPVREYVAWSPRAGGAGWEHAISYSMPLEEAFNFYLPQFTGILDNYWGRNGIHFHSEYMGAAVLVLALAGCFAARRNAFRWFWVGTFIVSLLWSLGGYTPFYHLVYAIVPGTKYFRAPSTMLFVVSFSIAVLAALGTERVLAREVRIRYVLAWLGVGFVIALLASMGALTNLAHSIAAGIPFAGRDELVAANNGALVAGAWRSFLFVALAAGLVWVSTAGRLAPRVVAWALAVVCAADLLSIGRIYWIFMPPPEQIYASDPAVQAIRNGPPGRVLAFDGFQVGYPAVPRDAFYSGDALMVHDIRLVRGYHGNELGRYQEIMGAGQGPLSAPFWRHENVRYLYTTLPDSVMGQAAEQLRWPGLPRKLVGPIQNASGSTVYLYELPGENPPAWVATSGVKASDEQALGTVLDPRYDPLRTAILDTAASFGAASVSSLPQPSSVPVTVSSYEPGHISLRLGAPPSAGAVLVVSENYFPGWSATVDGRPASVARADYNLIGVELPNGASRVELTFRDAAYATGKVVTLAAVILAALGVLAGVVADRRGRHTPTSSRVALANPS